MLSNLAVVALAAAGAVNAGPLQRRQETATSAVSSAASSVASEVSSAASSVASEASSTAASGASSAASEASSTAAEATSSAASATSSAAEATSTGEAGNSTYPLYPCPAGFLLTYAAVNQTVELPVTNVTSAAGEWATSPLFPNVTDAEGGNDPGATHTINLPGGISLPEVLVSYEANDTSGSAIWVWNGSLPEPATAMGVTLSNYSTVLQIYDPDYTTSGEIGNSTFINLFTNACLTPQAEGMQLLMMLGGLELGNIAAALGGNMTEGGMTSMEPGMESTMMSGMESSTMMESGMSSAAEATSTGASAVSSVASEVTESAASAASSAVSGAESAAPTTSG